MKHLAALTLVACAFLAGCASNGTPTPGPGPSCQPTNVEEIQALFRRWNHDLEEGDSRQIVSNNYASRSILLPTAYPIPRVTADEKIAYFDKFLKNEPSGKVTESFVVLGCNTAVDAGLYTFTYHARGGEQVPARFTYTYTYFPTLRKWLITSHHSSVVPPASPD